jgi:hypothetical protein
MLGLTPARLPEMAPRPFSATTKDEVSGRLKADLRADQY